MTQEELAGALGIHVRTVRNIENRHFAPSPRTVLLFAELEKQYKRNGSAEPMKSPSIWKSEPYSMPVRAALVKLGVDELELTQAPMFTDILEAVNGGLPEVARAMRFSNDPNIVAFLKEYCRAHEKDRAIVPWEAFALKAGVDIRQLLGAITLTLLEHGVNIVKVIAITHHPDVVRARIKNALKPGGVRDRNAIDKMLGLLPASTGDTIFNFPGAWSRDDVVEIEPNDIDLNDLFPDLAETQKMLAE